MTSIEWLEEQFKKQRFIEKIDFEQAKEMHKQEIIDAFVNFVEDDGYIDNAEQYYQETFGSKGSDEHIVEANKMIDQVPDVRKMVEDDVWEVGLKDELNKLPYTKHLDDGRYNDGQLAGFELGATWGYNKAKETLYTEEQMIGFAEWISGKYSFGNILGKWYLHENTNKSYTEKEIFDLYIQSLKQPKKD